MLVPGRGQLPETTGTDVTVTLGEFWGNVQTLVQVFNGRCTSGPRSAAQNRAVGGVEGSYHLLGLAADIVLADWQDKTAFTAAADRLGIRVIDEVEKKQHLHLQPK